MFSGLAAQGLLIVSGILAARMLGPTGRGYLALIVLAPLMLGSMGGLGLPQALTYWSARDQTARRTIARTILPAFLGQAVGLTLIHALVLAVVLPSAPAEVASAGLISLFATPAILTWQYGVAISQGQLRFGVASASLLLAPALYGVGLVVIALAARGSLVAVTAAWTAAYAVTACVSLGVGLLGLPSRSARTTSGVGLRRMLGFGLRGLLGLMSPLQTLRLDQVAVGLLLSATSLGLYVVALAFTNLPVLVATFMGVSISGTVAAQADRRAASRTLAGILVPLATATMTMAAVLIVLAEGLIVAFFGREFAAAAGPARILLVGATAAGLQRSIGDGLRGMGDPTAGTLGEVTSWVVVIPGILLLSTAFGIVGVAFAVSAANVTGLAVVATCWYLQRAKTDGDHDAEIGPLRLPRSD